MQKTTGTCVIFRGAFLPNEADGHMRCERSQFFVKSLTACAMHPHGVSRMNCMHAQVWFFLLLCAEHLLVRPRSNYSDQLVGLERAHGQLGPASVSALRRRYLYVRRGLVCQDPYCGHWVRRVRRNVPRGPRRLAPRTVGCAALVPCISVWKSLLRPLRLDAQRRAAAQCR
jgi:hypothetical protein